MSTFLKSTLAFAAALAVNAASAGPITYNVNLAVGDGTATGTITTDGTIGSVGAGNIVSWSILLAPVPGSTFTIDETNSQIGNTANLIGTLTDLSFNFDVTSYWLMQNPTTGSGVNFLCFSGGTQVCGDFAGGISMSTNVFGADFTAVTGTQIVATANGTVPEPATWGLAAIALLGAAAARRRKA